MRLLATANLKFTHSFGRRAFFIFFGYCPFFDNFPFTKKVQKISFSKLIHDCSGHRFCFRQVVYTKHDKAMEFVSFEDETGIYETTFVDQVRAVEQVAGEISPPEIGIAAQEAVIFPGQSNR